MSIEDVPLPIEGLPDPLSAPEPAPETEEELSADRRRTLRQRQAIDSGRHPLTRGPLHEFASPEVCSPDAAKMQPYTCGSCRFREMVRHHGRAYPKCVRDLYYGHHDAARVSLDDVANVSHGAATDVRAWWPACAGYESGDPSVSRDAARSLP